MRAIWTAVVVAAVAAFLVPGLGTAASGFELEVTVTGNGTVTSDDGRIDCPSDCSASYDNQETVTLTAKPAANETFQGWESQWCQGDKACQVQMTGDRAVTARFSGTSPEPSATASPSPSTSPSPTATADPSPTATAGPSPTATASPAPTATASPTPSTTPVPAQSPAEVAAHLAGRVGKVKVVRPGPRPFSVVASKRFTCRRECVVAAVLRSRSAGTPTLARGSARYRSGRSPGVTLRFTKTGRRRLADRRERARLTITVEQDGRFARRSRSVTVRVRG